MAEVPRHATLLSDMALLGCSVVWGAGFPFGADLLRELSPLWMVAIRLSIAAVLMAAIFRKRLFSVSRVDLLCCLFLAGVDAVTFIFMTFGLKFSTAGKQAFISGTSVVMVPLILAVSTRKWPSFLSLAAALVTSAGLMVMAFTPGMSFNFGDLMNLLMAFSTALAIILIGAFSRRMDPFALAAEFTIFTAFFLVALAFLFEPFPHLTALSAKAWKEMAVVSVGGTVLACAIQCIAQKYSPETHAAILISLQSPFGYLFSILMGMEVFRLQIALGGLLTLLGVFLIESGYFIRSQP